MQNFIIETICKTRMQKTLQMKRKTRYYKTETIDEHLQMREYKREIIDERLQTRNYRKESIDERQLDYIRDYRRERRLDYSQNIESRNS